jgi:catechol-2,3-dioxygenase
MTAADAALRERMVGLNKDLTPMRINEIVLKTARFDEMKLWYQAMLGLSPFFERSPEGGSKAPQPGVIQRATDFRLCFIRLHRDHPYAQILAIFEIVGTREAPSGDPGLHHMQLRNATMDELFQRYDRLKSVGIVPHRTANHGPGTSFYYHDPDRNVVEISANNFATAEDYAHYFTTDAYRRNPSGIEIDADAYIARYRSGVSLDELVKIPV